MVAASISGIAGKLYSKIAITYKFAESAKKYCTVVSFIPTHCISVLIRNSRPWWATNGPHHDDVIKWKHFPRYWPFVRGIHRSTVNSPHKGQWRGALMFSLICAWINDWVNNGEAGDLRRHLAHYDVIVMCWPIWRMIHVLWLLP